MIPQSIMRRVLLPASSALVVGCAPVSQTAEANHKTSGPTPAEAVHGGLSIRSAIQRTAEASRRRAPVWPGFDPQVQVLLWAVVPDGPVYLIGDPAPPAEYRWIDERHRIAIREGVPPDSLRVGLRVGRDWNGRTGVATALALGTDLPAEQIPQFLLHEAFHTHQSQVNAKTRGRFSNRANVAFPDTSVEAVALLNLEGAYLGRAVGSTDASAARALARTALALRAHRCVALGEEECAKERSLEQIEGTATFVATQLLGEALGHGGPAVWRHSLVQKLSPVQDLSRLKRPHFYDSGHAWLLLLERIGPTGWENDVELLSPDEVLAQVLGLQTSAVDSLVRTAKESDLWRTAQASARVAVHGVLAGRDSAERAFWDRPGVPVRVYFGYASELSTTKSQLPDGRMEQSYDFDASHAVIRGPVRSVKSICCPGVMTIALVSGHAALVDGRRVLLDQPGTHATGTIRLDLPDVAVQIKTGALRVYADSIVIEAQ